MIPTKKTDRIVQTGTLFMLGAVAVEAAAMADLPVDDYLTRREVQDVQRQIKAESLRLKLTGKSRRPHVGGCRPVLGGAK